MPHEDELLKFVKELMQNYRSDITELQIAVAKIQANKDTANLIKVILALLTIIGALIGVEGVKDLGK